MNVEFKGGDYFEELKFSYLKLFYTFENTPFMDDLEDLKFLEESLLSNILVLPIKEED